MTKKTKGVLLVLIVGLLVSLTYLFLPKSETKLRLVGNTSVNPVLYNHQQFETDLSKDYKPLYDALSWSQGPAYSTIPGLAQSDTISISDKKAAVSDDLDPQGLTLAQDFIVISAYSESKDFNSVLWLLDRLTGRFIKTIVLPDTAHVGGIAYDKKHDRLWIATSDASISSLSYQQLLDDNFLKTKKAIAFEKVYLLNDIYLASYMTYYDDSLFVGYFDQTHGGSLGYYRLAADGLPEANGAQDGYLNATNSFATPDQIQGITVNKDKVVFSQSFGADDSRLLLYDNPGIENWQDFSKAKLINNVPAPAYLEEIEFKGEDLYLLFESASLRYRADKFLFNIDRILKIQTSYLNYQAKAKSF